MITVENKKTKTKTQIGNTEFDFDNMNNNNSIPKYRDFEDELESPTGRFSKSEMDMFKMYENMPNVCEISQGMVMEGKVIGIDTKQVILDVGNKDNVIIERRGVEENICKQLQIEQNIDVMITSVTENPFMIKGSLSELVKMTVDSKMTENYNNDIAFDAYVKEVIPAGYVLDIPIDGITVEAFMPNTLADVNKLHDANVILNKTIKVMLETLQKDKMVYVVSRKKYLETLIPQKIKEIKEAKKETIYRGTVTGTMAFGVFIQFEECLTGMIHKANIHEDWQERIHEIKPGMVMDFYVKDIIKGNQIILSQNLKESLWDTIKNGDTVEGEIISIKSFGTLVKLDYETNGLIKKTFVSKANKEQNIGDKVQVTVINVFKNDRKLYLTYSDDKETISKIKTKKSMDDDVQKLKNKFNNN